jgi:hypothetical protein
MKYLLTIIILLLALQVSSQPHGHDNRPCRNPNQPGCNTVPIDSSWLLVMGLLIGVVVITLNKDITKREIK